MHVRNSADDAKRVGGPGCKLDSPLQGDDASRVGGGTLKGRSRRKGLCEGCRVRKYTGLGRPSRAQEILSLGDVRNLVLAFGPPIGRMPVPECDRALGGIGGHSRQGIGPLHVRDHVDRRGLGPAIGNDQALHGIARAVHLKEGLNLDPGQRLEPVPGKVAVGRGDDGLLGHVPKPILHLVVHSKGKAPVSRMVRGKV